MATWLVPGPSKGSLYGAFGDKRQLFLRVFGDYCDGLLAAARRALGPTAGDAADQVDGFLRQSAAGTAADITHRGCLLAKAAAEVSQRDGDVITRARATLPTIEDLLATAIDRGGSDGRRDRHGARDAE